METILTFDQLPNAVNQLNHRLENIEKLLTQNNEQQQTEPAERLLTIQEAAEFLNLTVPTLYSKVSKGELPVMMRSKRLYFSSIELMQYLKQGRKKSNSDIEAEAKAYLLNNKKGLNNGK
jgi:excisionase family DNA binding protein